MIIDNNGIFKKDAVLIAFLILKGFFRLFLSFFSQPFFLAVKVVIKPAKQTAVVTCFYYHNINTTNNTLFGNTIDMQLSF